MMPIERSLRELCELPLEDEVREHWLTGNARAFLQR
jgi:hypothetical protein